LFGDTCWAYKQNLGGDRNAAGNVVVGPGIIVSVCDKRMLEEVEVWNGFEAVYLFY
jgi:hypothetical protein